LPHEDVGHLRIAMTPTTPTQRPLPVADEQSAPYWEAASRHVLALPRCSRCASFSHPPDGSCPHCHTSEPDFIFTPVTGRGVVRSWTVMRQSFLPGFEVPFVLVDVEIEEQGDLRLIGRLLDGENPNLRIGARVTVAFEELAPDVAVPAFTLESPA
jgi:uncharacterized OB-fold protein